MKKLSSFILSVVSACCCSAANAYDSKDDAEVSKERQLSSYAPLGIHIGSFNLTPHMAIGNEYDTNIYRRDSRRGETDSYVAHFKPGFELASDWNNHALYLTFASDITEFATQSEQNNYEDIFVNLGGRLDVIRDSFLEANFSFNNLHEDRGSPDQTLGRTPTFYDRKAFDIGYTHSFNRVSVNPAFQFARYDYRDTPTSTSAKLKMSTRSRWEYTPTIKFGYEIQPEYEAYLKFIWREVAYDNRVLTNGVGTAFERDSQGYNALAGMAFDLTDLITGDISIGYLHRNYSDPRLPTISGVNGFINLKWRPTQLTTLLFSFSRDINETTQQGVAGIFASSTSIDIEHELLRNVLLNAGGYYTFNEYNGFNPNNPVLANRTNREEDIYGGNAGVKYLLNRHFSLGLSYRYSNRDANYQFADYEVHQIMFTIHGQI